MFIMYDTCALFFIEFVRGNPKNDIDDNSGHFTNGYVRKVGQNQPWEITIDKNLEKMLGEHIGFYKKGLVCESQVSKTLGFETECFTHLRGLHNINAAYMGVTVISENSSSDQWLCCPILA
jgi:hypothetical protein